MRVGENGLVRVMRIRIGREKVKQVGNNSFLRVKIIADGSMRRKFCIG